MTDAPEWKFKEEAKTLHIADSDLEQYHKRKGGLPMLEWVEPETPSQVYIHSSLHQEALLGEYRKGFDDGCAHMKEDYQAGEALDHQAALQAAYAGGLEAGYGFGFAASGEGYNAEYPFSDHYRNPESDEQWLHDRDVMLGNLPNKYEVK